MNKKRTIMLALAGTALAAVSQVQAQNTYNNEDLLLNFRNTTSPSGNDVTVDLGNVNSFVSTVAGLTGGTAVLDTGTGFTATTAAGLPTGFSYAGLTSAIGYASGNGIGFSAAGADSTGGTALLFLSRKQTSASLTPPSPASFQQSETAQAATAQRIGFIGQETTGTVVNQTAPTTLSGSGNNAVSYPSSDTQSYQNEAQDTATHSVIDYATSQSTAASRGGLIEQIQTGGATIYEALWEVPASGNGSDTYEGYFTYKPSNTLVGAGRAKYAFGCQAGSFSVSPSGTIAWRSGGGEAKGN